MSAIQSAFLQPSIANRKNGLVIRPV